MKSYIWCGLLLALWAGHAGADPNTPSAVITQATGPLAGNSPSPLYPALPIGSSNPLYVRSSTLALDASIQQLITILNAPLPVPTGGATAAAQAAGNATLVSMLAAQATAANQSTANGYLSTLATFSSSASTSALQTTGNGFLSTLATASASQATAAKQDTGNTSLGTITTNTGAISTGTGAPADSAYTGSGSASVIATLKGIYAKASSPAAVAYTDTVKSLSAASDTTLLSATAGLKSVCLMNIGTNPATFTNGASAAVVGNGQALSPAAGTGFQGGGYCFPLPPTNAIHGISALGTTIIVTVGQ